MTWYDSAWQRRAAVCVNNHSGAGQIDISAVLPPDWDGFWTVVQTAGQDVRVVDGAGTALSYQLVGFSKANRAGSIEVNDFNAPSANAAVMVWVYWDNANAADGQSVFTAVTPKGGNISRGQPGSGSEFVVVARPEAPGADNSRTNLTKHPSEVTYIWWDVFGAMMKRREAASESLLFEEVASATYDVIDDQGASQAGMVTLGSVRMLHPGWVRTEIKGGTDDNNYVVKLTVTTTEGRTLTFHATLKVRTIHAPT